MKLLRIILALLPATLVAQTATVTKTPGTNAIKEDLVFGSGRTLTIASGGLLDISSATLTLPARLDIPVLTGNALKTLRVNAGATALEWSTAGSADASTNTSTSVDGEVVLFSGTGGKTLKRATGSGLALLSSGVLGTVTLQANLSLSGSTLSLASALASINSVTAASATDFYAQGGSSGAKLTLAQGVSGSATVAIGGTQRLALTTSGASLTGTLSTTGSVTANGTAQTDFSTSAPAGNYRGFIISTSGSPRWYAYAGVGAESGSNAGSDFALSRYSDSGVFLGDAIAIVRSSGATTIGGNTSFIGGQPSTSTTTGTIVISGSGGIGVGGGANLGGELSVTRSTAGDNFFSTKASGDSVSRFTAQASGLLQWGSGSGAVDVSLYRTSAGTLRTSGNYTVDGNVTVIGGAVNNVTITAPASNATLTIANGKTLTASNTLTLTATDGSTLAIGSGGTLGTAAFTASSAYQPVSSNLTAISNIASAGFVALTGSGTSAARVINGTTNQITVTNGDGVSGNVTISIPTNPTLPGNVTAGGNVTANGTGQTNFSAYAPAGQYRGFILGTSGSARWYLYATNGAEAGANAGSDLTLSRYADNGAYIADAITINRATGNTTIGGNTTITGNIASTGTGNNTFAGSLDITRSTAGDTFFTARATGDSVPRFSAQASGLLQWGSGSGAVDVSLYRTSAGTLRTSGNYTIDGNATVSGTITAGSGPTTLTNAAGKVLSDAVLPPSIVTVTSNTTLDSTHRNKWVRVNSATPVTLTYGTSSLLAEDECYIEQQGAGTVTLTTSGTTLNKSTANSTITTRAQYSVIGLKASSTTVATVFGDVTQ